MRNLQTKDPKIVSLIHNVRSHPELYDYRLPTHREENLKEEIWESIAATCGMENAAEAKMYWKNLHYSFTVFYRNELIRLVRANYEEEDIGPIPEEIISSKEALFGNQSWGYYSDMRFIAPFRVKGIDPELDRLIELAKPIVCSDAHKEKLVAEPRSAATTSRISTTTPPPAAVIVDAKEATTMIVPIMQEPPSNTQREVLVGLDVPEIKNENLSLDDTCLRSFFDSLYRSTRTLPKSLQRRVKREMLVTLNNAEADAEEMEAL